MGKYLLIVFIVMAWCAGFYWFAFKFQSMVDSSSKSYAKYIIERGGLK